MMGAYTQAKQSMIDKFRFDFFWTLGEPFFFFFFLSPKVNLKLVEDDIIVYMGFFGISG